MFGWLGRKRGDKERQRLAQEYRRLLESARDLQRSGDIQGFAAKTAEAEAVAERLDALGANDAGRAASR